MDKFNPFNFSGRLGRLQYFGFAVVWSIIIGIVAMIVAPRGEYAQVGAGSTLVLLLLMLAYATATISYGIRRLHDFDKSGWWYLLNLVPLVSIVMGLILIFAPPTPGANQYGVRQ